MELTATWALSLTVELGQGQPLGETLQGITTIIPITGGLVEGPGWRGRVLPGGADWNTRIHGDLTAFYARYNLQTEEGVLITVINEGIVPADLALSVVKTRTNFLVDLHSPYSHLLHGVHVGTLDAGEISQGRVKIGVYRLS